MKNRPVDVTVTPLGNSSNGMVASFSPAGGVPTNAPRLTVSVSMVAVMIADPSGPTEVTRPAGLTVATASSLDDQTIGWRTSMSCPRLSTTAATTCCDSPDESTRLCGVTITATGSRMTVTSTSTVEAPLDTVTVVVPLSNPVRKTESGKISYLTTWTTAGLLASKAMSAFGTGSPFSSVRVTYTLVCTPRFSVSDRVPTMRADGGRATTASSSALISPLATVMSELPGDPTEVRTPASSTEMTDSALEVNVRASPGISRPEASTTLASSRSVPASGTRGVSGVTTIAAGTRGPRSSPQARSPAGASRISSLDPRARMVMVRSPSLESPGCRRRW